MTQPLQQTGDFLQLTRDNEWHLDAFDFTLDNGTKVQIWDTGVICFEPANAIDKDAGGKDIVLSSAVHGNETAPIEICDSLIKKIIAGELELKQRVLFLFGNPASINFGDRFVEENLNRLFSGNHSHAPGLVNKERIRAKKLEHYVARFFTSVETGRYRCHYDLHTAIRGSKNEKFAIYPCIHGAKWKKDQFELLLACGVNTFLLMNKPATTFSYFSSHSFGADSFTVELGMVRPFGENDMSKFAATEQTFAALISDEPLPTKAFDAKDFHFFDVYRMVDRLTEDFSLNFADDTVNFTDFPVGYVLADDGGKKHVVDVEGEAIVFPNAKVAVGQRALLTVIPMDVADNVE
ncbi:MAG: succinylglutamate desuccinylase [Algicola sp.]|nr:succinylglutamate desuccinylase [Algicola sp.]